MANTFKATSGRLGVDLMNTVSSTDYTAGAKTNIHALGTRVDGNGDSEWVYVKASAAISQYALVGIKSTGSAVMMTSTLSRGAVPLNFGIAQTAFALNDYGWVAIAGLGLTVLTTAVATAGARLYTTDTAGRVSTVISTASNVQIGGLIHSVTTGATASSAPCIARNLVAIWPALLST